MSTTKLYGTRVLLLLFAFLLIQTTLADDPQPCSAYIKDGDPTLCHQLQIFEDRKNEYRVINAVGSLKLKNKETPQFRNYWHNLIGFDEPLYPIPVGPSVYFLFFISVLFCWYLTRAFRHFFEDTHKKLLLHPETAKVPVLPLYWLQQSKRELTLTREVRNTWAWLAKKYILSPDDPLLEGMDDVMNNTTWDDFHLPKDTWSLVDVVLKLNQLFVEVKAGKSGSTSFNVKFDKSILKKLRKNEPLRPLVNVPQEIPTKEPKKYSSEKVFQNVPEMETIESSDDFEHSKGDQQQLPPQPQTGILVKKTKLKLDRPSKQSKKPDEEIPTKEIFQPPVEYNPLQVKPRKKKKKQKTPKRLSSVSSTASLVVVVVEEPVIEPKRRRRRRRVRKVKRTTPTIVSTPIRKPSSKVLLKKRRKYKSAVYQEQANAVAQFIGDKPEYNIKYKVPSKIKSKSKNAALSAHRSYQPFEPEERMDEIEYNYDDDVQPNDEDIQPLVAALPEAHRSPHHQHHHRHHHRHQHLPLPPSTHLPPPNHYQDYDYHYDNDADNENEDRREEEDQDYKYDDDDDEYEDIEDDDEPRLLIHHDGNGDIHFELMRPSGNRYEGDDDYQLVVVEEDGQLFVHLVKEDALGAEGAEEIAVEEGAAAMDAYRQPSREKKHHHHHHHKHKHHKYHYD